MVRSCTAVVENTPVQICRALLKQWLQNLIKLYVWVGRSSWPILPFLSQRCTSQLLLSTRTACPPNRDSNICPSPFPHQTMPVYLTDTNSPNSHANVVQTRTLGPQPCTKQMCHLKGCEASVPRNQDRKEIENRPMTVLGPVLFKISSMT